MGPQEWRVNRDCFGMLGRSCRRPRIQGMHCGAAGARPWPPAAPVFYGCPQRSRQSGRLP